MELAGVYSADTKQASGLAKRDIRHFSPPALDYPNLDKYPGSAILPLYGWSQRKVKIWSFWLQILHLHKFKGRVIIQHQQGSKASSTPRNCGAMPSSWNGRRGAAASSPLRARGGGLLLDRYNFADVLALEHDRVAASSAPFPGCVMVNQLPTDEPSSACALCGQPFNVHNNHVYAWRSTGGKLYCSEFCADDEDEEARFPYRRRA